jgi:ankyrin repeat protein
MIAARNGHEDIVDILAIIGADINGKTTAEAFGRSALMLAAEYSTVSMVLKLLTLGANVNLLSDNGDTALFGAVRRGRCPGAVPICVLLLDHGADINHDPHFGFFAIHQAVNLGNLRLVSVLLERGSKLNTHAGFLGQTPLHLTAINGNKAIAKTLLENGARVDAEDAHGSTPLICAAENNHFILVTLLLEKGANVNRLRSNGWSALHLAVCAQCSLNMATALVTFGANVLLRGINAQTALQLLTSEPHDFPIEKTGELISYLTCMGQARDMASKATLEEFSTSVAAGAVYAPVASWITAMSPNISNNLTDWASTQVILFRNVNIVFGRFLNGQFSLHVLRFDGLVRDHILSFCWVCKMNLQILI